MGEWTNLKINDGYECRMCMKDGRMSVTISTIYGEWTESVAALRRKVQDPHLLPDVGKMLDAMLAYAREQGVQ